MALLFVTVLLFHQLKIANGQNNWTTVAGINQPHENPLLMLGKHQQILVTRKKNQKRRLVAVYFDFITYVL